MTLGGTTLVAGAHARTYERQHHLAMRAEDGGRTYDVVILGGMGVTAERGAGRQNGVLTPLAQDYTRSFKLLRSIPCDVPLGSHSSMYNMTEKYARLVKSRMAPTPSSTGKPMSKNWMRGNEYSISGCEEQKKAAGL